MAKSFMAQFKGKYKPNQPVDSGSMVKRPNSDSNAKSKSRKGITLGGMSQANPGQAMKSSFGLPKKKSKRY